MIPGTQRHDVHDRSHMMWYVHDELRDMWYQIKQKQEKMAKARAKKVYSSTPSSGVIVEDEMICIARTASYVKRIEANSRRLQKHERRSTYTAVRAFLPVCFHHFSNYSSTPTYVVVVLSMGKANEEMYIYLSLIHIWRCRRIERCRSRWSPYH